MKDPEAEIRDVDDVIEAMEDARDAGLRIARIVKDLAAIARPDPRRSRVRLVDVAAQAVRWVRPLVERDARIELRDEGAPDVAVAVGQVEQVVVNLLTNAARATPRGSKGEIVVRVGPGAPGMARLEVIDRGEGIAPEIVDRIFEPFFTTRQVGQRPGAGTRSRRMPRHRGGARRYPRRGDRSRTGLDLPARVARRAGRLHLGNLSACPPTGDPRHREADDERPRPSRS